MELSLQKGCFMGEMSSWILHKREKCTTYQSSFTSFMGSKKYLWCIYQENAWGNVFQQSNFSIKKMYNVLRGDFVKVSWRKMICNNPVPPNVCLLIG